MDEQTRGSEMPRSSLRKFMNDPKTSVMSYLAENMAAQHAQQQLQQQNHGPNSLQQSNSTYGQQYPNQGSNGSSSQFQTHVNASQTSLTPSQLTQNGGSVQTVSPQIGQPQQNLTSQITSMAPYLASNVVNQSSETLPSQQSVNENSQPAVLHQTGQIHDNNLSMTSLGKAPPTSGMKHISLPQSAPRLYHRMNLDFEAAKGAFFAAKAQHDSQEMTSTAYDLESLSRRIWSLRFEHAWEFEGYEEAGHRAVIANWQAQYELWADTVLDIQEGDSAASMFAIQRASAGTGPLSSKSSVTPIQSNEPYSYGQFEQPKYQEIDSRSQGGAPGQQTFAGQPSVMDQKMPVSQMTQSTPPPQYLPHRISGAVPPLGSPLMSNGQNQQPAPYLQQRMTPPLQQAGSGNIGLPERQTGPPQGQMGLPQGQSRPTFNGQNDPPVTGLGPSNNSTPPSNQPYGASLQQPGQQMRGTQPPNEMQPPHAQYAAQRLQRGSYNNDSIPPQGPMQQLAQGQIQPSRPENFASQGPQRGGQ